MPTFGQNLQTDKENAYQFVKSEMRKTRELFITDLPGQENIYRKKEEMAKDYLAQNPEPANLDNYGLMAAEVGLTAPTALELAQLWVGMADQWQIAAGKFEKIRLQAKADIDAATSRADLETAKNVFGSSVTSALAELSQ